MFINTSSLVFTLWSLSNLVNVNGLAVNSPLPDSDYTSLSATELATLDALVATIQPGPTLNFSDPVYAPLVAAIENQNYRAPHLRVSDLTGLDTELKSSAAGPLNFWPIICETSGASPSVSDHERLHAYCNSVWGSGSWCDQRNDAASRCTNLATFESAQFGTCGDVNGKKSIGCRELLRPWKEMIDTCKRDGRTGGRRAFRPASGRKPHNRLIMH
ncbi:hypothetical protein BJ508DRAFT_307788 [Ascobolus immersus RN42]|uniref:Uncharacterized protein n=1 Tax=Ascobolus immersus RN42 TaxID=1160509 RepID=A0A3N4IEC0_ASCIM|nr:hypothetical protein BJ508DRAFT_307788 [Ascobolus immersus RN42]